MRLACLFLMFLAMRADGSGGTARPRRVARAAPVMAPGGKLQGSITVTPASLQFQSDDPDRGEVPAVTPATVSWRLNGNDGLPWTLTVQAASPSFENCPAVPVSAVRVTCLAADQHRGVPFCSASFPLSPSPQLVAGGPQISGTKLYTVEIEFALSDTWRYTAAVNPQCAINLTYTVDFQ
ncbi:MAG: hypothetical protein M1541_00360 [Acidobacteria bacterium]|nr:hypothetical protein [Acidobacteriota bacterium]